MDLSQNSKTVGVFLNLILAGYKLQRKELQFQSEDGITERKANA